jgi:hypothetical protein
LGTWVDALGAPFRSFNAALLLGLPTALDAVGRFGRAGYNSAVDAFVEDEVSRGLDRNSMERLGRELKGLPEAFPVLFGLLRSGAPSRVARIPPQLRGQVHHGISSKIYDALEESLNLQGLYRYRDRRFETRAIDKKAHNGWDEWHRGLDAEVAGWIRDRPRLTPEEFERYLHSRYAEPDLRARFPNGLSKGERR